MVAAVRDRAGQETVEGVVAALARAAAARVCSAATGRERLAREVAADVAQEMAVAARAEAVAMAQAAGG